MTDGRRTSAEAILDGFAYAVTLSFVAALVHQGILAASGSGKLVALGQATAGIVLSLVPAALTRWTPYRIPAGLNALIALFLLMALNLGSIYNAYDAFPQWDTFQHAYSAMVIVLIGLGLFRVAVPWSGSRAPEPYPAGIAAVLSFSFAGLTGVCWEIYEWTVDGILPLQNSQRFLTTDKVPLVGRAALADTMEDLITNTLGALVMACVLYVALRRGARWLDLLVPSWVRAGRPEASLR